MDLLRNTIKSLKQSTVDFSQQNNAHDESSFSPLLSTSSTTVTCSSTKTQYQKLLSIGKWAQRKFLTSQTDWCTTSSRLASLFCFCHSIVGYYENAENANYLTFNHNQWFDTPLTDFSTYQQIGNIFVDV
jgi:hypothetical protein